MKMHYKKERVIDNVKTGQSARNLRQSKDLTLFDISSRIDISITHLCLLERGQRTWTQEIFDKYQKAIKQ